jgi:tRNA (cmo5U34)-methyltransferase
LADTQIVDFDGEYGQEYEKQIKNLIPTYDQLFNMGYTFLKTTLEENARLLVVGAGGGKELTVFGPPNPKWTFTGVDPSSQMLEIAKKRSESLGFEDRVTLYKGIVEELVDTEPFDAATCLLVLHFIPDDGSKLSILKGIAERLKLGAPLILACMVGQHGSPEYSRQMAALSKHRELIGLSPEFIEDGMKRMEATPIVPDSRVLDLLQSAGFGNVLTFYGSYLLRGWAATKI